MAEIKNLKVKAGEKDTIKAAEVNALYIVPKSFLDDIKRPFIDGKNLVIEADNGRWKFDLDKVTYFEFDLVNGKRYIHVSSRATMEEDTKDESFY